MIRLELPITCFSMSHAGPLLLHSSSRTLPSAPLGVTREPRYNAHFRFTKKRSIIFLRQKFSISAVVQVQVCTISSLTMSKKEKFNAVVVGGTFDRLHEGHMLLLNTALSLVEHNGRLVVGISNGALLSHKTLSELIQPFKIRAGAVEQYLKDTAKSNEQEVNIECLEIVAVVPDGSVRDPQLDCIVVTKETEVDCGDSASPRLANRRKVKILLNPPPNPGHNR